jgi:hypothetical protein
VEWPQLLVWVFCNSADMLEWAAGLFEGEGTATRCRGRIRLGPKMTDEEPVRRFAGAVGVGSVYGPYHFKGKDGFIRRPFWYWVAEGEDAWRAADLLWPWLSERRSAQITSVFESDRPQLGESSLQ